MSAIIFNPEQVSAAWLTSLLHERGLLPRGKVKRISIGRKEWSFVSSVCRLEVFYSEDVISSPPSRLFLKISHPTLAQEDAHGNHSRKEVLFYQKIAQVFPAEYILPCYSMAYDSATGASHILLKDVSETHELCLEASNERNCTRAMEVLARHHAYWWDHPSLGKDVGTFPTKEDRAKDSIETTKCTTSFMEVLGDRLCQKWKNNYEKVLAALPRLFRRHSTGRNLTLAHGDSHLGNFLFPRESVTEQTYLIDWQFWHPTIAGTDLAFMIATEWNPEIRRRLEQMLLRRYYNRLIEYGVQNYRWDDCWNDYRLSVILVSILIPVWRWATFKWPPDASTVDKSMTAFEDLNCSELL